MTKHGDRGDEIRDTKTLKRGERPEQRGGGSGLDDPPADRARSEAPTADRSANLRELVGMTDGLIEVRHSGLEAYRIRTASPARRPGNANGETTMDDEIDLEAETSESAPASRDAPDLSPDPLARVHDTGRRVGQERSPR